MATLSGIVSSEQKIETLSRDMLRKIVHDQLVESIIKRVKAHALMGHMICEYAIPDTFPHTTSETLIQTLKPRLPDVSITQLTPRSIIIDWT